MSQNPEMIIEKTNKFNSINEKHLHGKNHHKWSRRQLKIEKNIFNIHHCKELISLIYKEQVKIQEKETEKKKSMGKMGKRFEQTIYKMTLKWPLNT